MAYHLNSWTQFLIYMPARIQSFINHGQNRFCLSHFEHLSNLFDDILFHSPTQTAKSAKKSALKWNLKVHEASAFMIYFSWKFWLASPSDSSNEKYSITGQNLHNFKLNNVSENGRKQWCLGWSNSPKFTDWKNLKVL